MAPQRRVERYIRPLADLATAAVCKQYVRFSIVDFNREKIESTPVDTPIINAGLIAKKHPRGGWVSEIQLQPIQPADQYNQHLNQKLLELLNTHVPFVARAFYLFCASTNPRHGYDQKRQYLLHDQNAGFLIQELIEGQYYYKIVIPESQKLCYNFRNCRLTSLVGADELQDFANTQVLDLGQNRLNYASFTPLLQLPHIIVINLENNYLEHIPNEIFKLTGLMRLVLNFNRIAVLPAAIASLTNLQELILHDNRITALPKELEHLTKLNILRIDHNRLTSLPMDTFKKFEHLKTIWADGNPIPEKLKEEYLEEAKLVGFELNLPPEYSGAGYLACSSNEIKPQNTVTQNA